MTSEESVQPSCLNLEKPVDATRRCVIGACQACGKPIRIKPISLSFRGKPMRLTCSCGGVTAVSFSVEQVLALAEAKRARERAAWDARSRLTSAPQDAEEEPAHLPSGRERAADTDGIQGVRAVPAQ
jgi:hypothetical protein